MDAEFWLREKSKELCEVLEGFELFHTPEGVNPVEYGIVHKISLPVDLEIKDIPYTECIVTAEMSNDIREELYQKLSLLDGEYLTVPEVALLWGVSNPWVYQLIQQGRIPVVKFGSRLTMVHIDDAKARPVRSRTKAASKEVPPMR